MLVYTQSLPIPGNIVYLITIGACVSFRILFVMYLHTSLDNRPGVVVLLHVTWSNEIAILSNCITLVREIKLIKEYFNELYKINLIKYALLNMN